MDTLLLNDLAYFFHKAAIATYAGDGAEASPERAGFRELEFREGDWQYRDSYNGFYQSWGQEVIRHKGKIVWTQIYGGGMESEFNGNFDFAKQTFTFLKKAMIAGKETPDFRTRGPSKLADGDWIYTSTMDGTVQRFKGHEEIHFKGKKVFTHDFVGGLVLNK